MIRLFLALLFACSLVQADSIGIFLIPSKKGAPWGPESIQQGLGGAEECVVYMAEKLATRGHRVTVFGRPFPGSPHNKPEANPRYVNDDYDDGTHLDIAISWRMPHAAALLKKRAAYVYLWPQDLCEKSYSEEEISGFDDVLWLTAWEREQFLSVSSSWGRFTHIFGSGINPDQFAPITERKNPYACIWGSNYARGLDVLLDLWPKVKQQFPDATLDIYYGWQHYGCLTKEKESAMRQQIQDLSPLGVTDHGKVSHEELNAAYAKASLWTYPCTALETFCITALRAQMAGAVPVIISGSALQESVRNGYQCSCKQHYLTALQRALRDADKITLSQRERMRDFIYANYTWDVLADRWCARFREIAQQDQSQLP